MALNREWHDAHPMPPNASMDQRVEWHLEHARQCGCRDIPATVVKELTSRGIPVPARRIA